MRLGTIILAMVVAVALTANALAVDAVENTSCSVLLLDGTTVSIHSLTIDGEKLSGAGIPAGLTLDDVREIQPNAETVAPAEEPTAIVEVQGGRIVAKQVRIANEACEIDWIGSGRLSVALDYVRAIRLVPAAASADFDKALEKPVAEHDRVFVADDQGNRSVVTAVVHSLDERHLAIEVGGTTRQLPRAAVFGIVMAQPARMSAPPRMVAELVDGSVLPSEALKLANDEATITLAGGAVARFPWNVVSRVTVRSSRMAFVSDQKVVAEEQQAIVTLALAAQRDRSVMGGPLTLGGRTYDKGLGVHARSSLTFATDRKWDVFAATIGLDPDRGAKGDCVFKVLADGEELLSERMSGKEAPRDIRVPISGCGRVTLLVDPGEGLDLADHANWCDARFIANKR